MRVVVLVSLALVLSASAQNSPKDYLAAHNAARARVAVGPMSWDNTLAAYARNYANSRGGDCNLVHSGGPYGENLATGWSTGDSSYINGTEAVTNWVDEKQFYDYASNSCAAGKICGHYTQVVWRNSTRVGCARTRCNNIGWYVICSYNPPGNFVGERPY